MDLSLTVAIISLIVTIVSILVAIVFGVPSYFSVYYAKKDHDKKNQDTANRESQIHERFNRAIDQLGTKKMEIRMGAISSLEMIADKSEEYYWPIMENLTAYLRKNSHVEYGERTFHFEYSNAQKESIEVEDIKIQDKVSLDIHAIVTVIRRRRYFFNSGEADHLDLQETNLREANFQGANLQGVDLKLAYLRGANFREAKLQEADLEDAKE